MFLTKLISKPSHLLSTFSKVRYFSTEDITPKSSTTPSSGKLVYEGTFSDKLKRLRRISLASSIFSSVGFPLLISYGHSTTMPVVGQVALASTIIFTSVTSTVFLQAICYPYVTVLEDISSTNANLDIKSTDTKLNLKDRKIRATRLNLMGNKVITEFMLSEVEKISASVHPFASFRVKETNYYVWKGNIADDELRLALTF